MQDSIVRHRDAVHYNEALAVAAENVAAELEHEEIKGWATGVGKQHRYHEKRHRAALAKLESNEASEEVPQTTSDEAKTVSEQQAEFAAQQKDEVDA
jgi:hypothetical protein